MNRILRLLAPDRNTTWLAGILSVAAFLLGFLDMLSRDFDSARFHLNLSIAIMAFLFLIKYISLNAAYSVADQIQADLREKISRVREAPPPADLTEAEQQAIEKVAMVQLANELKQALNSIPKDSPARPKYEATLELMQRISRRAAAHPG